MALAIEINTMILPLKTRAGITLTCKYYAQFILLLSCISQSMQQAAILIWLCVHNTGFSYSNSGLILMQEEHTKSSCPNN